MDSPQNPLLSVVVVIVSDTTDARCDVAHLAGNLQALTQQLDPPPMEIIVPYHPPVEGIEELKSRFPDVVFIAVENHRTITRSGGSREHHDKLRAHGLAFARGEIIGLLEDHARPDSHWCARMVEAHRRDYAAVGGAIENGVDRPLNWAVYFCDFGRYQNPVPAGESAFASDANITYKRSTLMSIRPIWQEIFHETAVNGALRSQGEKLALSAEAIVFQHRGGLRLSSALRERFIWGRSYAATRSKILDGAKRMVYAALSPLLPGILLFRMTVNIAKKGRCIGAFLKALPLTAMLTVSWSLGELVGYVTARARKADASAGEGMAPAGTEDH
ncbi:MAG: hypothetical protein L0Y67_06305 [Gammaproteobacteria bacterium]|nr:hypothetical protein [Gammaproteobacteria bacterium]